MLALISLLLPPYLMLLLRKRFLVQHRGVWKRLAQYFVSVFVLNLVAVLITRYIFKSNGNTVIKLMLYSKMALKYLVLSFTIAVVEIFMELFIKGKIMVRGGSLKGPFRWERK